MAKEKRSDGADRAAALPEGAAEDPPSDTADPDALDAAIENIFNGNEQFGYEKDMTDEEDPVDCTSYED